MIMSGKARQVLATLCANLLTVGMGSLIGWSSHGMSELTSDKSQLQTGPLTPAEADIIDSMFGIGGLLSSLCYGYVADKLGRKTAMRLIAIPQIAACLLVVYAEYPVMIGASRLFAGISSGGVLIAIPLFVSEIANPEIRGALGAAFMIGGTLGVLISYITALFMRYDQAVLVFLSYPVLHLIFSIFLRESSYYLIKNEKHEEARKALEFYFKGSDLGEPHELYESIKKYIDSTCKREWHWRDFKKKAALKALHIALFLAFMDQFCGCFVLIFNLAPMFKKAGITSMSPYTATVIVGLLQLAGATLSVFLVDRAGRRILYVTSLLLVFIGLSTFGTAVNLIKRGEITGPLELLTILGMALAVFAANTGIYPIIAVYISEISPEIIKGQIFTIAMMSSWVWIFTLLNLRAVLEEVLGDSNVMFFFGINCLLGACVAAIFFPETMGKTFEEISEIMAK